MKKDLVTWLDKQLEKAEKAVRARDQAVLAWRGGTDKSWKAVGCKLDRAQRHEISNREARILKKCQRDVQMIKCLIIIVKNSP